MKANVSHAHNLLNMANKKQFNEMEANLDNLKSRRKLTFEEEYIQYLVAVLNYMNNNRTILPKEEIEAVTLYEAIYHNRFGLAYDIVQKKSKEQKLSNEEIIMLLLLKEISSLKREIEKDAQTKQKVKVM
ncbi:MAG: hypothetical protein E7168_03130 [Firmicutes bacterium]|nr:hypothetical protein [Bacillota bacterium]